MEMPNLINPDDFKSMQVEGSMYNLTSQTASRKTPVKKTAAKVKNPVKLSDEAGKVNFLMVEIQENGLVIEGPLHSCAVGHNLEIEFWVNNSKVPVKVTGRAKVTELEPLDAEYQKMTIEFLKVDEAAWEKFCSLFETAQEKAMELFQSIRGY